MKQRMTKEEFKELVQYIREISDFYDKLYKLGIDIIECKAYDYAGIFFDKLMLNEFGKDGADFINWWLYEDVDHVIYDDENESTDVNDIDDLYDYLVKQDYGKE